MKRDDSHFLKIFHDAYTHLKPVLVPMGIGPQTRFLRELLFIDGLDKRIRLF